MPTMSHHETCGICHATVCPHDRSASLAAALARAEAAERERDAKVDRFASQASYWTAKTIDAERQRDEARAKVEAAKAVMRTFDSLSGGASPDRWKQVREHMRKALEGT